ncbi:hypothetical protein FD13_GL001051 [Levilactobacillus senmaizukei DSM 21775 = NBRC 103853]|uniref:Phage protein n=2 Tax=Levilactobacillus senmaizukei TaxID=431273 RepID=A0A0R2DCD0_9LACO|nr:hypothetical protein FD13_GL001051 [Levilactobacillus senmaizukei DSM 21775 = NBRC 103853]
MIKVPAMLTFDSINAIEVAYGKNYTAFEKDLTALLNRKVFKRDEKSMKLVWSLVYGLLIGGGTECTYDEMNRAIPFSDVPNVLEDALKIMQEQGFQESDAKK